MRHGTRCRRRALKRTPPGASISEKKACEVTYGCMLDACVKCGHLEKVGNHSDGFYEALFHLFKP